MNGSVYKMTRETTDQLKMETTQKGSLSGKVAIVTGSSRGIGAEIAKELAKNGAQVVINSRSTSAAVEAVIKEIEKAGGTASAISANVSDFSEVQQLIEEVKSRYGKIDILVNNAGITRDRTFRNLTPEEWHEVMDVNLNSAFLTTSAVINHMLERKQGRIINISSIIGQTGGFGQTNYAASKAGLVGFTKSLALETARTGITVNAILPGFIETEMVKEIPGNILENIVSKIPMQRLGRTSEVAEAVLFLSQAEYITGQSIHVNGGLYM